MIGGRIGYRRASKYTNGVSAPRMSHSFACQKISCQSGGRRASIDWTYASPPSRTAGTMHAAAITNQSRPIFTP